MDGVSIWLVDEKLNLQELGPETDRERLQVAPQCCLQER